MKLNELEESKDQVDLIVDWIANRFVNDTKREMTAANQMAGVVPDSNMIHNEVKRKLKDFISKVDAEVYHLVY